MPDQKVLDAAANAELDHLIATTMQLPGASLAPTDVRMKSGSIYFRKDAHWLPEYEDELVAANMFRRIVRAAIVNHQRLDTLNTVDAGRQFGKSLRQHIRFIQARNLDNQLHKLDCMKRLASVKAYGRR